MLNKSIHLFVPYSACVCQFFSLKLFWSSIHCEKGVLLLNFYGQHWCQFFYPREGVASTSRVEAYIRTVKLLFIEQFPKYSQNFMSIDFARKNSEKKTFIYWLISNSVVFRIQYDTDLWQWNVILHDWSRAWVWISLYYSKHTGINNCKNLISEKTFCF